MVDGAFPGVNVSRRATHLDEHRCIGDREELAIHYDTRVVRLPVTFAGRTEIVLVGEHAKVGSETFRDAIRGALGADAVGDGVEFRDHRGNAVDNEIAAGQLHGITVVRRTRSWLLSWW